MTWEMRLRELLFFSLVKRKLRGNLTKTYSCLMGSFKAGGARLFPVMVLSGTMITVRSLGDSK